MSFELKNIGKVVENDVHLEDISWSLRPGQFNTLLGSTLSGKTSIMRIMAGLDKPTSGRLFEADTDITDIPVKRRSVAMVYQQFINYPGFSVHDNIAAPLRNLQLPDGEIDIRVEKITTLLKLGDYLPRKPLELSGGQQQRVALARALAKQSDLILLDEPLANLDYKLREELRSELPKIFSGTNSTVVYATTEPEEALLLGGNVGVLHEGRLVESGSVLDLYQDPKSLGCAEGLSDPPLNVLPIEKKGAYLTHNKENIEFEAPQACKTIADGMYTMALRPHHLHDVEKNGIVTAKVKATDITGSETYVHLKLGDIDWTLLKHGIHNFTEGEAIELSFNIADLMLFDQSGHSLTWNTRKAA